MVLIVFGYQDIRYMFKNLYYLYTASKVGIASYRLYDKVLSKREKVVNIGDREKGSLYYLVKVVQGIIQG